ncbi:DUF5954 family protein [Streptomyces sp. PR69]|uniref:DUF5954 family protein n=1 Tax=Streptomyces sp. PR69 TaxID=2984950 RepID=UPI0022649AD1|nr:DUF5954 family protein [Streptomyces sp. PR69]
MNDYGEGLPAYRTIRMVRRPGPIAAFAEEEAWRARKDYPQLMGSGLPTYFYTRERDMGGWEILGVGGETPQGARDSLAARFRQIAAMDGKTSLQRKKLTAAAEKLDWVRLDEMKVLGRRYRVVRAEPFVRMGPDGPEPPRPSDPDPADPGDADRLPDPVTGFVIDPYTGTGVSEGLLRFDLSQFVTKAGGPVPKEMCEDSKRARYTHPGAVLLPVAFGIAEKVDGRWRPHSGPSSTPQDARETLAMYFRVFGPVQEGWSEEEREVYRQAAERLDAKRGAGIVAAGRRFRVVRIERMVRIGPDGPEPPRPSDWDPDPPIGPHVQQLKEAGEWREEHEMEPPSEEALEMHELLKQEMARRESLQRERRARAEEARRGRPVPPE